MQIYPRVFLANRRAKIFFAIVSDETLKVKIQPMEEYSIKHTPEYKILEEYRYPYYPLTKESENLYSLTYDFQGEQRYSVRIKAGDKLIYSASLFAVEQDLYSLNAYKGDIHLHSTRSDGAHEPFEVVQRYREKGYDFIALTDHHKFAPSIELNKEIAPLTSLFRVFRGEEVHNKDMGYFHVINFNGNYSINEIIETDDDYVESELQKIIKEIDGPDIFDARMLAYRIFIAREIRKSGGLAVMAHPFWDVESEYHMQTSEFRYLWEKGEYDALEVFAGCDSIFYGSNLQLSLWTEMRAQGYDIPVVGVSDAHNFNNPLSLFNKSYTLVFAKDFDGVQEAIKSERSVAVYDFTDKDFLCAGRYRFVNYARFLLTNYFPEYTALTSAHATSLAQDEQTRRTAEKAIIDFQTRFFGR